MESKALECSICYQEYDLDQRVPMVLVNCGHTICQFCLKQLIQENNPKCPLDKKLLRQRDLNQFSINYSLKGVIEEMLEWDRCKEDGEKIEFICKTDKCKVCSQCWHYENHQGHSLMTVEEVKSKCEFRKQELEKALKQINEYYKTINDLLDCKKVSIAKEIDKVLGKKEAQIKCRKVFLLFDLINYVNYEKELLFRTLNHGFKLKHEISDRLKKLNEIQSKSPWNISEENISGLTEKAQNVLQRRNYFEVISKRLYEVKENFQLAVDATIFEDDFNSQYFNLINWFEKRCSLEENTIFPVFEIITILSISFSSSSQIGLLIKTTSSNSQSQKQMIELETWKDEKVLTIVFEGNKHVSDQEYELIYTIRRNLKKLTTINIVLSNNALLLPKEGLLNVLSTLFLQIGKLEKISLISCFQELTNFDSFFILFKEKFLCRIPSRTHLFLYFEFVDWSTDAAKNFLKSIQKHWGSNTSLKKEGDVVKIEIPKQYLRERNLENLLSLIPQRRFRHILQNYDYPYYYPDLDEFDDDGSYLDFRNFQLNNLAFNNPYDDYPVDYYDYEVD